MYRTMKALKLSLAGLLFVALTSLAAPTQAFAQHGCVWDNGGCVTGRTASVYSVSVYYGFEGQWHHYGRYFATKYSNGAIDWGGAEGAVRQIQTNGLPYTYTSQFWRVTNNG